MVAANPESSSPAPSSSKPALSERRMAANRENAKLSTGPRTAEGKAISRRNAVRHGGLCLTVGLLAGEDAQALDQLRRAVHESLKPADRTEAVLVEQYVSASWRLRRIADAEAALNALTQDLESPEDVFERTYASGMDEQLCVQFASEQYDRICRPRPTMGELLAREVRSGDGIVGSGPRLRLIALEDRLNRSLGRTIRQLKELRLLRRIMKEDEPEQTIELDMPLDEDPAELVQDAQQSVVEHEDDADAKTQAAVEEGAPERAAMSPNVPECSIAPNEPNAVMTTAPATTVNVLNEPTMTARTVVPEKRHS